MRVQHRSFAGGYRFRNFEGQPEARQPQSSAVEQDLPAKATILIAGDLLVAEGGIVRAGQALSRDDASICSPAIATVSGTVEGIGEIKNANQNLRTVTVLANGDSTWDSHPKIDWQSATPEELEERVYAAGVAALCEGGMPTRFLSSSIGSEDVEHVIVQATQSEPYNPSPAMLMRGHPLAHFGQGMGILSRMLPAAQFHVVVDRSQRRLADEIGDVADAEMGISLYTVSAKFPQHREEVLVPTILRRPYPYGFRALNVGVLVLDFAAILHLYEAVVEGRPVVDRIVALCGPGFHKSEHVRVRIGTPIAEVVAGRLVDQENTRLVANSAMTGDTIEDWSWPVTQAHTSLLAVRHPAPPEPLYFARPGARKDSYSNTFLSRLIPLQRKWETNVHGEKRACIGCAYCDEVCPSRILPHHLHRYVERNIIDENLVRYQIVRCMECNLCTYVCPSKIPVAELIMEGKRRLVEEGFDLLEDTRSGFTLKGIDQEGAAP